MVEITKVKIYTLEHPITGEIRYIGKTIQNINKRLNGHLYRKPSSHVSCWIKSLRKVGLTPTIKLLDEVDYNDWALFEKYWICQFKSWGFKLCNHSIGGESGREGVRLTDTQKEYLSKISSSRKHSDKSKRIISEKVSKAWKEKREMNIFKYQRPKLIKEKYIFTEKHKQNLRIKLLGRKLSLETTVKMSKSREKPISQNTKEGVFIKEWASAKEAAHYYKIDVSCIRHCLAQRKKSAAGFVWKFVIKI